VPEGGSTELPAGVTRFDVLNYALEAMQEVINHYRLAGYPPDVLITIPKDACRTLDFHLAEPMVELGRQLAARALDEHEAGKPGPLLT
jgi:NTE family protein